MSEEWPRSLSSSFSEGDESFDGEDEPNFPLPDDIWTVEATEALPRRVIGVPFVEGVLSLRLLYTKTGVVDILGLEELNELRKTYWNSDFEGVAQTVMRRGGGYGRGYARRRGLRGREKKDTTTFPYFSFSEDYLRNRLYNLYPELEEIFKIGGEYVQLSGSALTSVVMAESADVLQFEARDVDLLFHGASPEQATALVSKILHHLEATKGRRQLVLSRNQNQISLCLSAASDGDEWSGSMETSIIYQFILFDGSVPLSQLLFELGDLQFAGCIWNPSTGFQCTRAAALTLASSCAVIDPLSARYNAYTSRVSKYVNRGCVLLFPDLEHPMKDFEIFRMGRLEAQAVDIEADTFSFQRKGRGGRLVTGGRGYYIGTRVEQRPTFKSTSYLKVQNTLGEPIDASNYSGPEMEYGGSYHNLMCLGQNRRDLVLMTASTVDDLLERPKVVGGDAKVVGSILDETFRGRTLHSISLMTLYAYLGREQGVEAARRFLSDPTEDIDDILEEQAKRFLSEISKLESMKGIVFRPYLPRSAPSIMAVDDLYPAARKRQQPIVVGFSRGVFGALLQLRRKHASQLPRDVWNLLLIYTLRAQIDFLLAQ